MYISKDPAERKQEILNVAAKLFIKKGYKKTSIDDIAKEIGVVKGTCYHYFSSKSELYNQVVKQEGEKYISGLEDILFNSKLSSKERFQKVLLSANTRFLMSSEKVSLTEINSGTIQEIRLNCFSKLVKGLTKCIDDGNKEGFLNISNSKLCAISMCYSMFGIISEYKSLEEIIHSMYELIASLLKISINEIKVKEEGIEK